MPASREAEARFEVDPVASWPAQRPDQRSTDHGPLRAGPGRASCGQLGTAAGQLHAGVRAMSSGRSEFSIDDAFELSLEEGGPGPGGTPPRFGALHFERKGRGDAEEEGEKQSRLKYQNLENDEDGAQIPSDPDGAMKLRDPGRSSTRSSQWSFSTISSSTQRSYRACCR